MSISFTLFPVVSTVTAGTAAVVVVAASNASPIQEWVFQNQGTGNVYLGGSGVTTSAGFLVAPGDTIKFNAQKRGADSGAWLSYSMSNYYVISAATGVACVAYYDDISRS